ncbi:MAG: hypothetical protein RLZ47_1471 [Bacteroidota bacterium]
MDSLGIPSQRFTTKIILRSFNELMDASNYIYMYHTNVFDFSKYRSSDNNHLGLLYPITLTGTQNNIGMIVLLGHTTSPLLWGDAENFKSTVKEKFFRQDVNEEIIGEIKDLYTSKYGKPVSEHTSKWNLFYAIDRNVIKQYSDTTRTGTEIKWETEYLNVTLFTGLASYDSHFDTKQNYYSEVIMSFGNFGGSPPKADPSRNEMQCYSYAYIKYELNEKAIEKLKLRKENI